MVLAAGSSRRLGRPKQTLAYRGTTVLGATLDVVRAAAVDQRIVTIGAAADEVRAAVDLGGFEVVEVEGHGEGCSASIVAAVDRVDPGADGFVLLLGDQPGVEPGDIVAVAGAADGGDAVVSRYEDGLGHPMWFARRRFPELRAVHGDKAVWKLLESGGFDVRVLDRPGRDVPPDVDTWDDYRALCSDD